MSTSATVFLGLPNIVTRGSAFVTTPGPEPVAGEASNLKDVEPRVTSRITSVLPSYTEWIIRTWGDPFVLDGVALVNTNVSDNGYIRVVDQNQTFVQTLVADQVLSSTNAKSTAGGVADGTINPARLDEAVTVPSTTYFEPITTTDAWNAILAFPTALFDARPGTATAQFILRLTLTGTPINVYPTIKVELRENGSLIRSLGRKAVTTAGADQLLIFAFNPAELAFPLRFNNLEIGFYGYPGDNGSFVKWNTMVVGYDYAPAPVPVIDSGWISANQTYFSSLRDGQLPTKSLHYLFNQTYTGVDYLRVQVMDDGAELNPPGGLKFGLNFGESASAVGLSLIPSGYIEAGVLIAGPKLDIDPGVRRGGGPHTGVVTESAGGISQAGQTFSVDAFTRRDSPQNLEIYCRREQMMELMVRVGWQKGNQEPFYVIQEPDVDLKYQVLSSFYCVCSDIQSSLVERGTTREDDMFMVTMRLTEKI